MTHYSFVEYQAGMLDVNFTGLNDPDDYQVNVNVISGNGQISLAIIAGVSAQAEGQLPPLYPTKVINVRGTLGNLNRSLRTLRFHAGSCEEPNTELQLQVIAQVSLNQ